MLLTILSAFTEIALPIIIGIAGLIIGMAIIFFVPFFRKQRAQNNARKIIREAEIKAEHITKNAQLDRKSTRLNSSH